jgi:hypothetical protein
MVDNTKEFLHSFNLQEFYGVVNHFIDKTLFFTKFDTKLTVLAVCMFGSA